MPARRLVVGELETNCYLIWRDPSPDTLIVDAGGDAELIAGEIERLRLQPRVLFATHGHVDHVAAAGELKGRFPAMRFAIMRAEREFLARPTLNLSLFLGRPLAAIEPDILLDDGDELAAGPLRFRAMHLPGHTPGGGALVGELDGVRAVFSGDALFAGSVGRSDLPGGDGELLVSSIRARLLPLGDETRVFPGHGPETTIGEERRSNPFIAE